MLVFYFTGVLFLAMALLFLLSAGRKNKKITKATEGIFRQIILLVVIANAVGILIAG